MIKNYLIISLRNLLKNKVFSIINIIGLSIGISAFMLIMIYVKYEFSFDKFHKNADNLYRIVNEWYNKAGTLEEKWALISPGIAPDMKSEFSEVKEVTRILFDNDLTIIRNEFKYKCENLFFVDPTFFKVFSFPLITGNPNDVLIEPNTVVISKTMAKRIFKDENPINQTIEIYDKRGKLECAVKGIMEDMPSNSHIKSEVLVSYKSLIPLRGEFIMNTWYFDRVYAYALLDIGVNPTTMEFKFPGFVKNHHNEPESFKLKLQPIKDIHLKSDLLWDTDNSSIKIPRILSLIAIIILIMAWINYVNISTSKSQERAKEVGVRKVLGGEKKHIRIQFFLETAIQSLLAIIIVYIIVFFSVNFLNNLMGTQIFSLIKDILWLLGVGVGVTFIGVILSGIYPSISLSSFKPIVVLKGKFSRSKNAVVFRNALILFQFIASIIVILGSITIIKQVKYMMDKDLGFDGDNILVIKAPIINYRSANNNYQANISSFKSELSGWPSIEFVSSSYVVPGGEVPLTSAKRYDNQDREVVWLNQNMVDFDYLTGYKFKFIAGRNFSREYPSDQNAVILSEKSAKKLGFNTPQEALQKKIFVGDMVKEIIGVIQDFNQLSLKDFPLPFVFTLEEFGKYFYSIKLPNGITNESIKLIKEQWEKYFKQDPFEYFILKDHFNEQYKSELLFKKLITLFTFLAVVIACLGIFGLSSYISLLRVKEICVRKVLGAELPHIIIVLSKFFMFIIGISYILALPIAIIIVNKWLQNYTYKISLDILIYILPLFIMLFFTLLTLSYHIFKVAYVNPTKILKYE